MGLAHRVSLVDWASVFLAAVHSEAVFDAGEAGIEVAYAVEHFAAVVGSR